MMAFQLINVFYSFLRGKNYTVILSIWIFCVDFKTIFTEQLLLIISLFFYEICTNIKWR